MRTANFLHFPSSADQNIFYTNKYSTTEKNFNQMRLLHLIVTKPNRMNSIKVNVKNKPEPYIKLDKTDLIIFANITAIIASTIMALNSRHLAEMDQQKWRILDKVIESGKLFSSDDTTAAQ